MPVLMPSPVFRWFVPAQNGTGLVPAAGYIAAFYSAGTDIAKTIYHPDGTPYASPANEATLNSEGYAGIWLGAGSYKLRVLDPDRAEIYTLDNITGSGSFGTGFVETVQPTDPAPAFGPNGLAQLDPVANKFTWVSGYWAVGDGGHGFFWNETSSEADDTGYVIASAIDGTKRWFRVQDEDGSVRAASFGYIGSKAANLSSELLAASAYASGQIKRLVIGPGSAATLHTSEEGFSLYALGGLYLEPGSMLTSDGSFASLFITGYVSGSAEQHFTDCQAIFETPQMNENPEWFGAALTLMDNTAAFAKWFASQAAGFTLPPGAWNYANTAGFPYPTVPMIFLGSITAGAGGNIPTGVYFPSDSRFRLHQILFPNGAHIEDMEGAAVKVTGDTNVIGALTTSDGSGVFSGANVSAQGVVAAGLGGIGSLTAVAGSGGRRFNAAGRIETVIGSASTSGTGATDLLTASLPDNSILNEGDALHIVAAGTGAGAADNHVNSIAIHIGSSVVFLLTLTAGYNWYAEVDVFKSGSNFVAVGKLTMQDAADSSIGYSNAYYNTDTINWTITNVVKVIGSRAVSGALTNKILTMDCFPAPT